MTNGQLDKARIARILSEHGVMTVPQLADLLADRDRCIAISSSIITSKPRNQKKKQTINDPATEADFLPANCPHRSTLERIVNNITQNRVSTKSLRQYAHTVGFPELPQAGRKRIIRAFVNILMTLDERELKSHSKLLMTSKTPGEDSRSLDKWADIIITERKKIPHSGH